MIVDPDFLDHWRTRMVVDALGGDELAPTYILRLWAHCQLRKSDRFAMPPAGLKAQCRYAGDAGQFELALIEAGFVERDGDSVVVLGWAEQNSALIAAWENGAKGGRPKKPNPNPRDMSRKPTGNPAETHGKPNANPDETDKRGEEKNSPSLRSGEARATRLPKPFVLPDDYRQFCENERPDLNPDRVAAKFADFWHGKPGKSGTKLDWLATWRNWVREERVAPRLPGAPPTEPAWRSEQRERTRQAAPGVAAGPATDFFDVEARNVPSDALGGSDLRQADPDLRPILPSPVG